TISWNFGDGATGTGAIVTHSYSIAQTFTVTATAKDSSSPQQTVTSSQTVTVSSSTSLTGNFGSCASLPQGWNCGNALPSTSSDRYHIYIALYYWLPNGAVSAGGPTYQCLDTQVRVENVGGSFSPVGSTATYDPGDSFGWDQVTLSDLVVGQSYTLTANVGQQCQRDLAAWGLPSSTQCQLAGIEIGTEGYQ